MALPPATAFRPWWLKGLNAGLPRLWARNLLPPPDLEEATLDRMARAETGLDDFGDDGFARGQLRVLLTSVKAEARLNPFGTMIAHGSLLKVLKERLWAQALFARHPEILARPIVAPVIIVGQMRSGTTRIHRRLAADPRFVHLRLFEAMAPVPWPKSTPDHRDPRIRYTARGLGVLNAINPGNGATHPTGALEPDEELGLLEASFAGAQIEAQRRVPSFARHCEAADQTPAYAHLKRLLQLTGWFRGDDPARPWVLKTPQHMQDLAALLTVFPDARLIFTHRDPVAVVASSASLAWHQMVVQSDHVDPHWIGAEWLHKTAHRARTAATVRRELDPAGVLDIDYDEAEADWTGTVARLYGWLGLPPAGEPPAEARHRAHHYRLEDFGLGAAQVRAAVPGYRAPALLRA